MRLTRDHLRATYPIMAALDSAAVFLRLLSAELGAWTDNRTYADDIARVIMSHVDNEPFSTLPRKLIPYRATIDVFVTVMDETRAPMYLRAISYALQMRRTPYSFRHSLCARANHFRLPVPRELFHRFGKDSFSTWAKARVPDSVFTEIRARAQATGGTVSEYVREAIYERMNREDGTIT